MLWLAWGVSDTGRMRERNEDALLIAEDLGLFAVADGMGGHTGGSRASQLAVKVLREEIAAEFESAQLTGERQRGPSCEDPPVRALESAAKTAGRTIYETALREPSFAGMGTTLTSLMFYGDRAYTVHVGDSRAYLFRDDRLVQLTVDHTWIEEQVRAGFMTREEAQGSEFRHIVTRSVGYEPEVRVDLLAMPALMGDCFLLCSDGLSNCISEEQMRHHLNTAYFSEVPQLLVDAANGLGGEDNVTVLVVYVGNDSRRSQR
jgi:protein phosphatase